MKKSMLCFVVVACLCFAASAKAESLRVVTLYSPPLAFERDQQVVGMAVDLVREGLRRMGYEPEIVIMPWKRALLMTRFGEADAIFYAVRNETREAWFHYPEEPLVSETSVLLKRSGEHLNISLEKHDYRHLRVGVGHGYYYGPELKEFMDASTFGATEEASTIECNFAKLLERRIDMFLVELHLARYLLKEQSSQGPVDIVMGEDGTPLVLDSVDAYLAFSRETMSYLVADQFSGTLKAMKADGTYQKIIKLYQ